MELKVKNLTLDEKLTLLCGKEHTMNIEHFDGKLPKITMSDGPHGLRCVRRDENGKSHAVLATAMPSLGVVANTWNRDLAKLDGEVIADECVENSIDLLLAPGVNIKKIRSAEEISSIFRKILFWRVLLQRVISRACKATAWA